MQTCLTAEGRLLPSLLPVFSPIYLNRASLLDCETGGAGLNEPILQARKLRPRRDVAYLKSRNAVSGRTGEGQDGVPQGRQEDQQPRVAPPWCPAEPGAIWTPPHPNFLDPKDRRD